MGIASLFRDKKLKVWPDLFNELLDDKAAPDLGDAVGGSSESIYSNPEEFFARTHMTKSMENLITEVADALENREGGSIFILTSLFGGGKTHTLIALHHAFSKPEVLAKTNKQLAAKVAEVKPLIVVVDGTKSGYAPNPKEPSRAGDFIIKTLWGMLAYRLGAYAKVMHLDGEGLPVPGVDTLSSVLKEANRPVLLLIDEILYYMYVMGRSKDLADYADKLPVFIDYLARAVESCPRAVLIVSLQLERRGDQLVEEEIFAGFGKRVYDALHRETTRIITPVTPTDVIQILKRRIFIEIPEDEAGRIRDDLYTAYKEYPDLFGSESDWQCSPEGSERVISVKDTYPFHPKYIEVLQEFISRNRDLRRTRDAIRLTRKIVRRVLRGREDPTFFMPWHIELRDPEIRNFVLTESRQEFRDVASKDIVAEDGKLGAIADCSRPELALKIAASVLLKVYTYETFKMPLRVFPTLRDVALMVYDPESFSSDGLQPPDIKTILDEMTSRLDHFNHQDGRYWFDPYLPIIDLVERRAAEILNRPLLELYKFLGKRTSELLLRKERRKGVPEERAVVFSEKRTRIVVYGDIIYGSMKIEDKTEHYLVIFIKPRESISDDEIESAILRSEGGGLRTYRNTVATVLPRPEIKLDKLLSYAAKIKAADEVGTEIKEIYRDDEEVMKIRREKLKQYIQSNQNSLDSELLFTLTQIAYPRMEGGRDTVRFVDTTPLSSIITQVEATLMEATTGPKLRTKISFDDLTSFLSRLLGWDLVGGNKVFEFGKIVEVFYTSTAAPFTTREVIEEAVLDGLKRLQIGIKLAGEVYWKKVESREPNLPGQKLKDECEILPCEIAAKRFADKLISMEGTFIEGGKLHLVWYEVEFADKSYKLRDLVGQPGWVSILKEGIVRRNEEWIERGFVIEITPSVIEIDEGGSLLAKVSVIPVGGYDLQVHLKPESGNILPEAGVPHYDAEWQIDPLIAGEHIFKLRGEGADGTCREAAIRIIVKSLEEDLFIRRLDKAHIQAKLIEISAGNIIFAQMALSKIFQIGAKARADLSVDIGDHMRLNGTDADIKISEMLVQKISEITRSFPTLKISVAISIKMEDPIILDEGKIAALNVLADKVTFGLKVRRKGGSAAQG